MTKLKALNSATEAPGRGPCKIALLEINITASYSEHVANTYRRKHCLDIESHRLAIANLLVDLDHERLDNGI